MLQHSVFICQQAEATLSGYGNICHASPRLL